MTFRLALNLARMYETDMITITVVTIIKKVPHRIHWAGSMIPVYKISG